jgi:uncharacterized protein YqiB (DUF1249 family)
MNWHALIFLIGCSQVEKPKQELVLKDGQLELEPVVESCSYTRVDGLLRLVCEGLDSDGKKVNVGL